MVVRHLHRVGIEVVQPRHEAADDEAGAREGLVHGRRLVHAADDRLEVVDRQRERVVAAVPSEDVERMVRVHVPAQTAARAHEHRDVFALDDERVAVGPSEVALAERRALEQLAALGEVLAGEVDVAPRLDHQELDRPVEQPPVRRAARDDDVVALARRRSRPNTDSSTASPLWTYTSSSPVALRYSGEDSLADVNASATWSLPSR